MCNQLKLDFKTLTWQLDQLKKTHEQTQKELETIRKVFNIKSNQFQNKFKSNSLCRFQSVPILTNFIDKNYDNFDYVIRKYDNNYTHSVNNNNNNNTMDENCINKDNNKNIDSMNETKNKNLVKNNLITGKALTNISPDPTNESNKTTNTLNSTNKKHRKSSLIQLMKNSIRKSSSNGKTSTSQSPKDILSKLSSTEETKLKNEIKQLKNKLIKFEQNEIIFKNLREKIMRDEFKQKSKFNVSY